VSAGALAGIRVLDFSAMIAGPYCTRLLADSGAEVIKLEPPEGDYMRGREPVKAGMGLYFAVVNAGKRSVALDLKNPRAAALVHELAAASDVVVENFRPGVMKRLGFDAATLRARHPRLVYCSISGYGQEGAHAALPAYAPIVQAASGYDLANLGYQRGIERPLNTGIFAADYLTGVHAFGAICAALVRRSLDRHGRIDGLVQCAGVVYLAKPWDEQDGTRARRLIEVNLIGTYNLGTQVLHRMQQQGHGAIVNVSSGTQAGMASGAAYAASKGGVAALTYAWAMDAGPQGIRVNALSPVATSAMTRTTDQYLRAHGQLQGERPYVDPASNAPAVAFLLSDAARAFNGQILRVHGEQVQLMSHPAVMLPVLSRETWDVDGLAQALDASFAGSLQPLGITGIEARFVPLAKTNQVPR